MAKGSTCTITYGSYVVGGATAVAQLDGPWAVTSTPEAIAVSFRAAVYDTANGFAQLNTNVTAFLAAFREIRQNISIAALGETLLSLSHSLGTGYDSAPEVTLVENYGYCSVFDVRIIFGRPADYTSLSGRRSSTIEVDYTDAKRKKVTISGVYTTIGSGGAVAKYESAIDAYASSVLSGIGGNYNLESEDTEYNETDKELSFTRIYIQRFPDNAHASITTQEFSFGLAEEAPGDSDTLNGETTQRLTTWKAVYYASVNSTVSTETGLKSLWSGTILPWIVNQVTQYSGDPVYVFESVADLDVTGNRISANVTLKGLTQSGPVEWSVSKKTTIDPGNTLLPIHAKEAFAKYDYDGPAKYMLTWKEGGLWVGDRPPEISPEDILARIGKKVDVIVKGAAFSLTLKPMPYDEIIEPMKPGLLATGSFDMWRVERTYNFEGYTPVGKVLRS